MFSCQQLLWWDFRSDDCQWRRWRHWTCASGRRKCGTKEAVQQSRGSKWSKSGSDWLGLLCLSFTDFEQVTAFFLGLRIDVFESRSIFLSLTNTFNSALCREVTAGSLDRKDCTERKVKKKRKMLLAFGVYSAKQALCASADQHDILYVCIEIKTIVLLSARFHSIQKPIFHVLGNERVKIIGAEISH